MRITCKCFKDSELSAVNAINIRIFVVLYCISLYFVVLHCVVLFYFIVFCCIVLYCIFLHCVVSYFVVLYCVVLHCKKTSNPKTNLPLRSHVVGRLVDKEVDEPSVVVQTGTVSEGNEKGFVEGGFLGTTQDHRRKKRLIFC